MKNGTKTYEHEKMLPDAEHQRAIAFFYNRKYSESPLVILLMLLYNKI